MTDPTIVEIAGKLNSGERRRLIAGRLDWRQDDWQDHCGDVACKLCIGLIPDPQPNLLSREDAALRAHLQGQSE